MAVDKQARGAPPPEPDAELAHLTIAGLRGYRVALSQEEHRVSYWRRILQARIDTIAAGGRGRPQLANVANLKPVLTAERMSSGGRLLATIVPQHPLPPLPNLEALWENDGAPGDAAGNAELATALDGAEAELAAYRTLLHERIAAATAELIGRYRTEPALCLTVLPRRRRRTIVR